MIWPRCRRPSQQRWPAEGDGAITAALAGREGDGPRTSTRLDIYRNNIASALVRSLEGLYPALVRLMGGDSLRPELARDYARAHPPVHGRPAGIRFPSARVRRGLRSGGPLSLVRGRRAARARMASGLPLGRGDGSAGPGPCRGPPGAEGRYPARAASFLSAPGFPVPRLPHLAHRARRRDAGRRRD